MTRNLCFDAKLWRAKLRLMNESELLNYKQTCVTFESRDESYKVAETDLYWETLMQIGFDNCIKI